eukprot:GHVQ01040396.1.p1 GENE.GHVQ01040396.1~~GHVQ01040396.1.p1  ORF type:complete len:110 (+),score=13.86 GHVQ01040396.1:138-467(+)
MTDAATITAPTVMGRERREKSREVRSTGARNRTVKRMLIGGVLAYIIQFSFCVNHCVFPNTFIGVTAAPVSPFNGSQTGTPSDCFCVYMCVCMCVCMCASVGMCECASV